MTRHSAVLTVTLNAALDVTYLAPRFAWGEANRVEQVHAQAGGKGINVARVLHALGVPAVVLGLAGGETGTALRAELARAGLDDRLVAIRGESRRTVAAVSRTDGVATTFDEAGPEVGAREWDALLRTYDELLHGAALVVAAGSLPPGVPVEAYRELMARARSRGVPGVVDATGDALLAALGARPALVAPNASEAAGAGVLPRGEGALVARAAAAAGALRERGAESAVVSLGEEGAVLVAAEGAWHARAPRVTGNTVGAGDALVAALAAGARRGTPWPARLSAAVATAAAAVRTPYAGTVDEAGLEGLGAGVELEELLGSRPPSRGGPPPATAAAPEGPAPTTPAAPEGPGAGTPTPPVTPGKAA